MKATLTPNNIKKAYLIAAIADAMQLPLYAALFTGVLAIPSEVVDTFLDITALILISRWIGFHWCLLPCFFLEFVPGLELFPTWVAAVAYIVLQRRNAARPPAIVTVKTEAAPQAPPLLASPDVSHKTN